MDRRTWLRERRAAVLATYDADASTYDQNAYPTTSHREFVLANLHRATRPGGHLYLTVEEVDESAIDEAFTALTAAGVPAVRGEIVEGDVAGYHYYPSREQVKRWLDAEGLEAVGDAFDQEDGWGYRHLLLRAR